MFTMNKQKTNIETICKRCGGTGRIPADGAMRAERIKTGKSLSAVAQTMGISAAYLSDLELGNRQWDAALIWDYKDAVSK